MRILTKDQDIYFIGELLPMKVIAVSDQYAICTRKFDKKADNDYVRGRVEMSAYSSIKIANEALKYETIYTILGFSNDERGPHNLIFGGYDFDKPKSMQKLIKDLESGKTEISRRNRIDLNINWTLTKSEQPF